jgi:uncharacterized protein (DUF1800 family)
MTARAKKFQLVLPLAAFALLLLGGAQALAQKIDLNANGMSDIWEQLYGATALDPNADTDGDGVPNILEALAGTDPFDSNSFPKIAIGAYLGDHFTVTVPSQLGKQYELQSLQPSSGGGWTNWISETNTVSRSGSVVMLDAAVGPSVKLFRIAVSDVDTDGDGVNDWEEYKIGTDPFNAYSNGQLDSNGAPMSDYAYATSRLASQNLVTIIASDPIATEPDPGQAPLNVGTITILRGGFPLRSLTANVAPVGAGPGIAVEGVDHATLPRTVILPAGVSSQTIPVTPLANTNCATSVIVTMNLLGGSGYTVGSPSNASVVIYPSSTPNGTGLTGQYYTNSSSTYSSTANFNPTNIKLTRTDPTVDFVWGTTSTPIANNGYYCVRWTGQVQPQYSETYFFVANTDDGVKLWVNDQLVIDSWINKSAYDVTGTVALQGGVRYNIRMEYYQATGSAVAHLSWYSASQPKQIIPSNRLYPSSAPAAPTSVTSGLSAVAFLGQPFSFTVTGANSASLFTAQGLPPGLGFNSASGVISGTPNLAGDFQVTLTASNSLGVSASVLDLQVIDTGSSVMREVWLGVTGTNVADIPINTPATLTNVLGTLEGISNFGDNYGERIRGYFTAPVSGNYYFWLAAGDSAELWISNDGEPANKVLRSYVTAPGTASRQWTAQAKQRSPWLALVAGQRYYLEILHKAGVGTNDNWAVGWLQDPTGTNNAVSGVVPGYLLTRYQPLPPSVAPGTLYTAAMLPQSGATSMGVGSATLRLSADESQAILAFEYSSLTSPVTGEHIHSDPYLFYPSQIIFDIDTATPQPDGTYRWTITPMSPLGTADIVEIIKESKAYINIHTVNFPAGEINGHFTPADGTQVFSPPPAPPAWIDDHTNASAAARFLIQATFGPSPTSIASVQSLGYAAWISNQFSLTATHHLPFILANVNPDPTVSYPDTSFFNNWWHQSITSSDQLRQRVAFALSEIMVVSDQGVLNDNGLALSSYYDTLLDNAFGNFRSLLEAVTLHPAMGLYLDMLGNDKGNIITGLHANENYAREVMQLFSLGLNRLWPDGTLVMNSENSLVPTYDQSVIEGLAAVFTGWSYWQPNQANGRLPTNFNPPANYTNAMVLVPSHHDLGTKRLLDNVVLPQAWGAQTFSTNSAFDAYCSQDLELALDSIFYNQNVGPLICRELIQRLVTSNPSRDYLYRVVQAFNDNGAGVRGDMIAVIKAILLDYEARSSAVTSQPTFGKMREPLLRVTAVARAFPPPAPLSCTYTQGGFRPITNTLEVAHRLNDGDVVMLNFTDTSGQPAPYSQGYSINVVATNSFRVNAPGISSGTYTQAPNITISNMVTASLETTNIISVVISSHALSPGYPVYLTFTSGGATNGVYQVVSTNGNIFVVETADLTALPTNTCLIPKWTGGGYVQTTTNVTISLPGNHGLNPGDSVYIYFAYGSPASGQYTVASVPDSTHFTIHVANSASLTQDNQTVYPLVAPSVFRSGTAVLSWNTWGINFTDTAANPSLAQTPLNSPTVFNFFYPDYRFPGSLAAAGLTTPEFQLASDTSVALQLNYLYDGFLGNNSGNTNGMSSFNNGGGAIVMDLGAWMTPGYTSNAGVGSLVDALSSILMGGQLSPNVKTYIVNYVGNNANFPYTTPTSSQMRDRVRAVVHLLITSPDFTIQN